MTHLRASRSGGQAHERASRSGGQAHERASRSGGQAGLERNPYLAAIRAGMLAVGPLTIGQQWLFLQEGQEITRTSHG